MPAVFNVKTRDDICVQTKNESDIVTSKFLDTKTILCTMRILIEIYSSTWSYKFKFHH